MKSGFWTLDGHTAIHTDDVLVWGKWFEDADRSVARTDILGARIFTSFLGIDHNYSDDGDPLIFETMVFPPDSYADHYCDRYSTWDEAEAGHGRAVEWAKGQWIWHIKNIMRSALRLVVSFLQVARKPADTLN